MPKCAWPRPRMLHACATCADPAPGSSALLDTALTYDPDEAAFSSPAAPPVYASARGYQVGQRIPSGMLRGGTIAPSGPFALPIDPFSDYCLEGGLPIGVGLDRPPPASVRPHSLPGCVPVCASQICASQKGFRAVMTTPGIHDSPACHDGSRCTCLRGCPSPLIMLLPRRSWLLSAAHHCRSLLVRVVQAVDLKTSRCVLVLDWCRRMRCCLYVWSCCAAVTCSSWAAQSLSTPNWLRSPTNPWLASRKQLCSEA